IPAPPPLIRSSEGVVIGHRARVEPLYVSRIPTLSRLAPVDRSGRRRGRDEPPWAPGPRWTGAGDDDARDPRVLRGPLPARRPPPRGLRDRGQVDGRDPRSPHHAGLDQRDPPGRTRRVVHWRGIFSDRRPAFARP